MRTTLSLDVLTPAGPVELDDGARGDGEPGIEVPGVEVPGLQGELGILPGHIPFVTPIRAGVVRFRRGEETVRVAVSVGFLEVSEDGRVSILTERAALPAQIDVAAAERELSAVSDALAKLADYALTAPEHRELLDRRGWLEAQLRVSRP
jgi:F-type H+-transporting ATPase subunit epsilon